MQQQLTPGGVRIYKIWLVNNLCQPKQYYWSKDNEPASRPIRFVFTKSYFYFKDVQKVWWVGGGGGGGGGGKKLDIFVVYLYAKN